MWPKLMFGIIKNCYSTHTHGTNMQDQIMKEERDMLGAQSTTWHRHSSKMRRRCYPSHAAFLVCALLAGVSSLSNAEQASTKQDILTDNIFDQDSSLKNILIRFESADEENDFLRIFKQTKSPESKIRYHFHHAPIVSLSVSRDELLHIKETVTNIEEDPVVSIPKPIPVKERIGQRSLREQISYGLKQTQADQPLPFPPAGSPDCVVNVCIIDSGLRVGNADIPYANGDGFLEGEEFGIPSDQYWFSPSPNADHGTAVTGILTALGNNDIGVKGVIPEGPSISGVCLLIARIFPDDSYITATSEVMAASEWCVDKGANIINLSIASDFKSSQEMFLYEKYYNDDILMIAAAGNGNSDKYAYPASYDSVMSVASVDSENRVSSFSQLNDQVEIAAPGEDIHTTGGYGVTLFTGTSFATPFVAGIAAKIWAANPQCNAMQIRKALLHSAKPLSKDVPSSDTGYGLVQAVEASNYIILNLPPPCGGVKPTLQPTLAPTKNPTRNPTTTPTLSPTTPLPSGVPTPAPTTGVPTVSERPSFVPTASPTTSAPTTCQEYLQVCDVNNGAVCCSGLDCRSVNDSPAMANACQNSGAPFRILKLTFILPIVVIVLNEWLL